MNTNRSAQQQTALSNARNGASLTNYATIIDGFAAKGIDPADIEPRVNVFTFGAWRALGRTVRRGEHGVRVVTWIATSERKDANGKVTKPAGKRPHSAAVFHVSQTEKLDASNRFPEPKAA